MDLFLFRRIANSLGKSIFLLFCDTGETVETLVFGENKAWPCWVIKVQYQSMFCSEIEKCDKTLNSHAQYPGRSCAVHFFWLVL